MLDSGVSVLEITGFIEGRYMKESFTTLTFTHETWNDINKRLEQDYPYKKIVGWFHTHPGHGIFLSRYDTFIHQNFFPGKEQVAVVFDPLRKKCGFFVWEDKQIVRNYNVFIFAYGNENFQGEINNLPYTAQDNLDNMETKSYIDIDVDLSDPVEGKPRGKPFHEILSPLIEEQSFEPKPQLHQLKLNHLPSRKLLHHLLQIMQPWIQTISNLPLSTPNLPLNSPVKPA